jgi:hypothetical protein
VKKQARDRKGVAKQDQQEIEGKIRRQFCPFRANKQLRRDRRQDRRLSTKGAYYEEASKR